MHMSTNQSVTAVFPPTVKLNYTALGQLQSQYVPYTINEYCNC